MPKAKRKPKRTAQEVANQVKWARDAVTRLYRRSDAVDAVMSHFGLDRVDSTELVIKAEDEIAAEWGETEVERHRGKIAQIFDSLARNSESEKVRASAASNLAKLIGANRPKIVRVESQTDDALDALLREQLDKP